jgi:hypothetical protein
MSNPLATYLHDHVAGSYFAIKLLRRLHEQYRHEQLGKFALTLTAEITQDQETLEAIVDRVGRSHLDLTEATGWLAEKASQLKLRGDESSGGIGTFEALETLTLGILGKLALWHVLPLIRDVDPRVPEIDFEKLAERAEEQYAWVEAQRLHLARTAFRPAAPQ